MKLLAACIVSLFLTALFVPAALAAEPRASATVPAPVTFTFGAVTVHALADAVVSMPTKIFTGASPEAMQALAPTGESPAAINVFLIKDGDRLILVDAGFGKKEDPTSRMLQGLQLLNISPDRITHVLLTHMHGDHIGGLAWEGKAAFPNARIMVNAVEKDYWLAPATKADPARKGNAELAAATFALYQGKIDTFTGDITVLPGIRAIPSPGHTPGHTVYLLESQGASLLFWGDTIHAAALQFANPEICANFDMDKPQAVIARKALLEMVAEKKIPVAGGHLPVPGAGHVIPGDKDGPAYTFILPSCCAAPQK